MQQIRIATVPVDIGVDNAVIAEAYSLYRDGPDVPSFKIGAVERQHTVTRAVHFGTHGLMRSTSSATQQPVS